MTKEEYLQLRERDQGGLIYQYYKELLNEKRHQRLLSASDVINHINKYNLGQQYLAVVYEYYNTKFNILNIFDKDNKLIYSQ